ncbi:unnamed protein product [Enterobius vermicularis]|uniref:Glycogen debranching enzyme n=1 Tax=Enterobius vermicularis TaxID=51028 RepID=A0A0N4VFZ0_ENTVE|nr:unnamed protein product [Enterobius vermicularis]
MPDKGNDKNQQIRIVTLSNGEHRDSVVIRLHKGWIVRFMRGGNLLGKDVQVFTSISGEIPWNDEPDDLAAYAEIQCTRAGAFSYHFYVNGKKDTPAGSGYLQVLPELEASGKPLPLDAIICQTHLSKLLGTLPEWEDRLLVAKESGYNMIHFTPIHTLGISNSSYCIANQLELNPAFSTPERKYTLDDVQALTTKLSNEWGMLSIQDVVWNHTAKNSPWLMEHPECAYNCKNSPHLRPAYVVDRLLHHFSKEIAAGVWEHRSLPPVIETDQHIEALNSILRNEVYPKARLSEFFMVNVEELCTEFEKIVKGGVSPKIVDQCLKSEPGKDWKRFGFVVDMNEASKIFNRHRGDAANEEDRQYKCLNAFRDHLLFLNKQAEETANIIIDAGTNAVLGHVSYERVNPAGPKRKVLTEDFPLVTRYFLHPFPSDSWEEDEKCAYDDTKSASLMACNGWVMNDDPLKNFALYPSEKPEDCPFLWDQMTKYSQSCARIFHGVRIDNCHSTPIHVAEYLLKAAREIRPDLYVVAELFTGSENLDNIFVNRLGITSLIREAQNGFDSHEQGRFVYRYGGDVVGAFIQTNVQHATPCVAHALFYDQTHDNPSPIQKRSVYDVLPTAAMVAMASCANGSTRGYDELIPSALSVVTENRPYRRWSELSKSSGIIGAREVVNKLHAWLALNGYTQVFVDQMNFDIVAVTRHNPVTHETVILVAHTAFSKECICLDRPPVRDVYFRGRLEEILFEAHLHKAPEESPSDDESKITGLSGYKFTLKEHLMPEDSELVKVHGLKDGHVELSHFPSSSVVAFKISPLDNAQQNITKIRKLINGEDVEADSVLHKCLEGMSLQSYNRVLFRCETEERDDYGDGTYNIPNFGNLVYCGLQGIRPLLKAIRLNNDLGHPVCGNLRDGTWMCDYIVGYLKKCDGTRELGCIVEKMFMPLKDLQHYLRPCYFEAILSHIFSSVRHHLEKKLNPSLMSASELVRGLALSSVSFLGAVNSAKLPPLSKSIALEDRMPSSLSAGLPHFTTGIWRNWGRDTFIALPGCLLVTGRYYDARCLILSYAGTLRHGLIPNLLAEGIGPRYNCRDAVWFWLHAIVKYVEMAPLGEKILTEEVLRLYPTDDTQYGDNQKIELLQETMYEALQRHFHGIQFTERNAGHSIDEHMKEPGFNINAYIDRNTGFVCGGNSFNCGTWMDKMGSSEKAGNRGYPATPRDGAAVELQGLAYAVLLKLHEMSNKGIYPYQGVSDEGVSWKWSEWAERIKENFEKHFYVDDNDHSPSVNRRHIIKDSVGSSNVYTDYQLRPNFAITLAVAPKLVTPRKAWKAICLAEEVLMGPLGIKTLDPTDWAYNGFYDNSNDGYDKAVAQGWNYHQGPEWLWVAAYFLRAKIVVAKELGDHNIYDSALRSVRARMGAYWEHLQRSPWQSLPELTNQNGSFCSGSCTAQAWTIGCLLETVNELYNYHMSSSRI